jgi:N-acetylgalactosamine kinase
MTFHPFKITGYVPIPPEAAVLVAFSGQRAVKSAGARDRYNERVACYRLGILLLKRRYPRLASRLEHIRDVAPHRLGTTAPEVLRMIGALPNDVTRSELRRQLGSVGQDDLARIFASHRELGGYTVRDVVAFGVGECERSRVAAELLSRGDLSGFGELMLRSHDGDRVNGQPAFPDPLISGQTAQTGVPLQSLIGGYACSTPDIDKLVDLTRSLPGVYGAQLAGAGLGGCVMVLADRSVVRRVCATLAKDYYEPRGMSPAIWHVRSVSGGGLIEA